MTNAAIPCAPGALPILGVLPSLLKNPLAYIGSVGQGQDGIVRLPVPVDRSLVFVTHPDGVRHMMQTNHRNYRKAAFARRFAPMIGEVNLFLAEDDAWTARRHLIADALGKEVLPGLVQAMEPVLSASLAAWAREPDIDLPRSCARLALDMLLRGLFDDDLDESGRAAMCDAIDAAQAHLASTMFLGRVADSLPLPSAKRFRNAVAVMNAIVDGVIGKARKRSGGLVNLLLEALGDVEHVRSELKTLLIAGHETTGCALTWTLIALAELGDERLAAARRQATEEMPDDALVSPAMLAGLTRVKALISESMRLHPPVWWFARTAAAEDEILGHRIKKGATVVVSQWSLHRDPRFWTDPTAFDPDRFLNPAVVQRWAYLPYGAGPRVCVGATLANAELVLAVGRILRDWTVELTGSAPVVPAGLVTLRPRGPVRLRLARRSDS